MSEANVVSALAAVIAELPAIGKDGRASQQQGGYAYRGIEQITTAAAPLLAKYGVVFVPQVQALEVRDLIVNNKPWTDTYLTVRYLICGPGGPEDRIEATVVGIGRDNADKGANKALTQAFKYALIQTLCIADSKDDADGQTHEADAPLPPFNPELDADHQVIDRLKARIDLTDPDVVIEFTQWKNDQGFVWPWPVRACEQMHAELDRLEAAAVTAYTADGAGAGSGDSVVLAPEPPAERPAEKPASEWSITQLKDSLKLRGLSTDGSREELIARVTGSDF